ncbi:MAG: DUF222 domain-containing protein [Ilumatobacter sp.]|nr:DUF222 domain-containing protein [Ilumatobacter sp.]
MSGSRSPATRGAPLTEALGDAIANWSNDQRTVVVLAAEFADSGEWAASGSASAAHWIAASADIEVCTAREWIRVGRSVRSLPLVARLFDTGELSYSKVRTLTRVATSENESALVALAVNVPAGQLGRAIAAWMSRTSDDDELERRHQEQRSVVWRNEPDGMVTFTARLPPLSAGRLIARLQTHVMTSRPDAASLDTWPSLAQQHADALSALIAGTGGSLTTEVVLHVREDGATLDDGSPLPLGVVARIAPDAFIRALIHDAEGRPIDASSRRRHPTARQKRVVKERDRACVDCGSTVLLEYDHVPDFAVSGRTVVDELELRCAPCHRRRHDRSAA